MNNNHLTPTHLPAQPTDQEILALEQYFHNLIPAPTHPDHPPHSVPTGHQQPSHPHQTSSRSPFSLQGIKNSLPRLNHPFFAPFGTSAHETAPPGPGYPRYRQEQEREHERGPDYPYFDVDYVLPGTAPAPAPAPGPPPDPRDVSVTPDGLPLHHQRPIHSAAKPGRPGTGYNFEYPPADVGSDIDPLTLDPAQNYRIQSQRVERDEDESLAPSQSLSQSAFRTKKQRPLSQQPPVPAFQPISALKGGRRQSLQQPPLPLPPLDSQTMEGVLDWAGSVRPGSTRAASPKSRRPGSRQHHRPSRSGTSRRGGTNVDEPQSFGRDEFEETPPPSSRKRPQSKAGTGWSQVYPPSESETPTGSPLPALPNDWQSHRAQSVHAAAPGGGWESPAITDETPESEMMSMMDRMTLGARSGITGVTGVTGVTGMPYSSMGRMRDVLEERLEDDRKAERERGEFYLRSSPPARYALTAQPLTFAVRQTKRDDPSLHRSNSQLQSLQNTVRTLQAQVIAEQVTRSETEKEALARAEEVRVYRDELAGAVRALRRAKEESRKLDDERKKGLRLFEETRERLVKLREAYKVQEARDSGREEGRLEAFNEIERWMSNPPIPVEPMASLPNNVLHPNDQAQHQQRGYDDYPRSPIPPAPHPEADSRQYQPERYLAPQLGQRGSSPNFQQQRQPSPGQSRQAPSRATNTQSRPPQSPVPPTDQTRNHSSPSDPRMPPHSMMGHNAASSYLDRVEHDARMQNMLHGAPQRTFTMPSQGPTERGRSAAPDYQAVPDSADYQDKPLPSPYEGSRVQRSNTVPSRATHNRETSLSVSAPGRDILSPPRQQGNGRHDRSLSQADRYPAFPTHRTESILDHAVPIWPMDASRAGQSMDSNTMPIQDRGVSDNASAAARTQGPPTNTTHRTPRTARSRLAAVMRGEEDPLSMIEEDEEREIQTGQTPMMPHRVPLPPSTFAGTHRTARSMQSFMSGKSKPRPVMPPPLSHMPATEMTSDNNLRGMYDADQAARHTATLPNPTNAYHPEQSHSMFLPPEQRTEMDDPQQYQGHGGHTSGRTPTISVFPPSRSSSEARQPPLPPAKGSSSAIPADIPLPPTRPGTYYVQDREGVIAIDFAQRHPLPDSRPTTILERHSVIEDLGSNRYKTTVETVQDADVVLPQRPRPLPSILKQNSSDQALLPGSRGAGRKKTSTFVTIESTPRDRG